MAVSRVLYQNILSCGSTWSNQLASASLLFVCCSLMKNRNEIKKSLAGPYVLLHVFLTSHNSRPTELHAQLSGAIVEVERERRDSRRLLLLLLLLVLVLRSLMMLLGRHKLVPG